MRGGERTGNDEDEGERYTRRCFVMARAAVQFKKFARFERGGVREDDAELARRIREVCATPVWHPARREGERVVIRGWGDLNALSRERPEVLRRHIGLGWPTYARVGNFGIIIPPGRSAQERVAEEVRVLWEAGEPPILWLVNFPSLSINHAVVVVGRRERADGMVRHWVYDPNLPERAQVLDYDRARRTFSYVPTFYFRGGEVDVRLIYRGHLR